MIATAQLQETVDFVSKAHSGQTRNGGLPYIVHPFDVLSEIYGWGIRNPVIWQAALCHDVLEDCPEINRRQLSQKIGAEASKIVAELTFEFDETSDLSKSAQKAEYIKSFADKSLEALVIKCADRCCNTRDFYRDGDDYAEKYWHKADALFSALRFRREEIVDVFGEDVFARIMYSRTNVAAMVVPGL